MNKLMSASMLGLAPIAPTETVISGRDEDRLATENDEISPPVIERMATREEIALIREEIGARDAGRTKHAHWCSVLLRATWVMTCRFGGSKRVSPPPPTAAELIARNDLPGRATTRLMHRSKFRRLV